MTKEQVIQELNEMTAAEYGDAEEDHSKADGLILRFLEDNGFKDVSDAWHKLEDKNGGFWYA